MLVKNSARCRKCKDVIESKDMKELVKCKCGKLAISGGAGSKGYLYRQGLEFDELSEYERKEKPIPWPW